MQPSLPTLPTQELLTLLECWPIPLRRISAPPLSKVIPLSYHCPFPIRAAFWGLSYSWRTACLSLSEWSFPKLRFTPWSPKGYQHYVAKTKAPGIRSQSLWKGGKTLFHYFWLLHSRKIWICQDFSFIHICFFYFFYLFVRGENSTLYLCRFRIRETMGEFHGVLFICLSLFCLPSMENKAALIIRVPREKVRNEVVLKDYTYYSCLVVLEV